MGNNWPAVMVEEGADAMRGFFCWGAYFQGIGIQLQGLFQVRLKLGSCCVERRGCL